MSIELEWQKLNSSLATTLVDILNRQLTTTQRPSFIGPIEISSLDFGTVPPDVELVDLRDIYRDFLEDSDSDSNSEPDHENVKVTEGAGDDDDGFEIWRIIICRLISATGTVPSVDLFTSTPALHAGPPRDVWGGGAMHVSMPSLGSVYDSMPRASSTPDKASSNPPSDNPDLQLHLYLNWHSNLRLTLTTSLLINYPSPSFMSLPIKLSVTGLVFTGEVAVAYEGSRGRVHLCILDELDPYGPACKRPRSQTSSPPETDEDNGKRDGKPLPIGQRLLPSILIESEIGQADKHVLKNVTRVERFIQDVIRNTVEEELVFPNFHTLIISDQGRS
ncbi:hypothetical protein BD769DRAFT_1654766 [Suillus cothurnatus]|nr:hypothetical protein BD769DRAFT_1654766 [Suillus cothurnatus]